MAGKLSRFYHLVSMLPEGGRLDDVCSIGIIAVQLSAASRGYAWNRQGLRPQSAFRVYWIRSMADAVDKMA